MNDAQVRQAGNTAPSRSANAGDLLLLERIRRRDGRAFEQLYRLYHPRLTNFLLKLVRRPPLVEEVLNDTLMVVWQRPDSFHGGSKLSTWIFGIAYRKALKGLKRFDDAVEDFNAAERVSDDESPEQFSAGLRRGDLLAEAMQSLSPTHRAVVDLTYYQELDYFEIATILDCPVGTVKTRMFHARRHLRRLLDGAVEDWI